MSSTSDPFPFLDRNPDSQDEVPLWLRLCRDLLQTSAITLLWLAADHWLGNSWKSTNVLMQLLLGFVAGGLVMTFFHEWGHLLGAKLAGARVQITRLTTPYSFRFNLNENTLRQFQWMSWGGSIGPLLLFGHMVQWQLDAPGQQAFLVGAVVMGLGSSLAEFAIVWRTHRGYTPQQSWDLYAQHNWRTNALGYGCAFLIGIAICTQL